jgi:hypothetical protein
MPTSGSLIWMQVDSTGVVAAAGRLARPKPGHVYPLISATQAFDISNGWMGAVCFAEPAPAEPTASLAMPSPGCQPSHSQIITGAQLGLELEWQNELPILLPAWFFTVERSDGPVLGTMAIDRAYLQASPSYNSPATTPPSTSPSQSP